MLDLGVHWERLMAMLEALPWAVLGQVRGYDEAVGLGCGLRGTNG